MDANLKLNSENILQRCTSLGYFAIAAKLLDEF